MNVTITSQAPGSFTADLLGAFFVIRTTRLFAAAAAVALIAGCAPDGANQDTTSGAAATSGGSGVALTGAGATFPYPIYNKWFSDYAATKGVKINYQSIGSGGGVRQISEQTVDF